ncbi:MAG: AEC family transporter, partial [Chloroflexi bacterium]|nr:AEC family transporter [Chloroflexota bacterium]
MPQLMQQHRAKEEQTGDHGQEPGGGGGPFRVVPWQVPTRQAPSHPHEHNQPACVYAHGKAEDLAQAELCLEHGALLSPRGLTADGRHSTMVGVVPQPQTGLNDTRDQRWRRPVGLLLRIFTNNILPAFLVMGAGVLVDRTLHVDKKQLSRLALYVLSPCLVFDLISKSEVDPGQFGRMIVYAIATTLAMCLVGLAVGHVLRWPTRSVDGLILSIAFTNAGNFGLSVVLFTYGQPGLELASVFFVASSFTTHTLATFFANRSNGGGLAALRSVFQLPAPYAFVLALILRLMGWAPHPVIVKPVSLIAGAAVPVLLMLLGLQLSQTRIGGRYRHVSIGVFLRLIVGA